MNKTALPSAIISALIFSGGTLMVLANAHVDIFPCTKVVRQIDSALPFGEAPLVSSEGSCSLMAHLRDADAGPGQEKEELSVLGWALIALLAGGVGAADGFLTYTVFSRLKPATRA